MSPATKAVKPQVLLSKKLTGSMDQVTKLIEDNAKLMDLVQEVALELTHSIGTMHALTVKYAGKADRIVGVLSPILGSFPIFPKKAKTMLASLEEITGRINRTQASTKKTIADVKRGLSTANVSKLQNHADDLRTLTRGLLSAMPK